MYSSSTLTNPHTRRDHQLRQLNHPRGEGVGERETSRGMTHEDRLQSRLEETRHADGTTDVAALFSHLPDSQFLLKCMNCLL